jgi:predicted ATP-binding protein involved in virulence
MYIHHLEIKNIRAISDYEMTFDKPNGWHVLIGDNGTGKSSVIKAISLALVGPDEALGLRDNWNNWLKKDIEQGKISLKVKADIVDGHVGKQAKVRNQDVPNEIYFKREDGKVLLSSNKNSKKAGLDPSKYNWGQAKGWFSAAFGPYRRFAGGNPEWTKVFYSQPKLGAHLSAFGEDVALTEATEWLVKLQYQYLESLHGHSAHENSIIEDIKKLVNSEDFLPFDAKLESISSDGVTFKDGNGALISVEQLSDGYRSILSLTFELIRNLVRIFGPDRVFENVRKNNPKITLPGIVLIDEVDAHLHPTWQTRIGQWFTKYFPKIQFIVTTHSPLICRASEKGTIWRLPSPRGDFEAGQIKGIEKDRLVFGSVLDAYGTEVFGKNVSISSEADKKLSELAELNVKSFIGELNSDEKKLQNELKAIFPSESALK